MRKFEPLNDICIDRLDDYVEIASHVVEGGDREHIVRCDEYIADVLGGLPRRTLEGLIEDLDSRFSVIEAERLELNVIMERNSLRLKLSKILDRLLGRSSVESLCKANEFKLDVLIYLRDVLREALCDVREKDRQAQLEKEKLVLAGAEKMNASFLVILGDEYIPPHDNEWGLMVVDRNESEDEILSFVDFNRFQALYCFDEALGERGCFFGDPSFCVNIDYGFVPSNFKEFVDDRRGSSVVSYDRLKDRVKEIEMGLNEYDYMLNFLPAGAEVTIGMKNEARFTAGLFRFTVDINDSVEENLSFVLDILAINDIGMMNEYLTDMGYSSFSSGPLLFQSVIYLVTVICKSLRIGIVAVDIANRFKAPVSSGDAIVIDMNAEEEDIKNFIREHAEKWRFLNPYLA